jgi:hypothetical protein
MSVAIPIDDFLQIIETDHLVLDRVKNLLKRLEYEENEIKNTFPYRKKGHWMTAAQTRLSREAYERAKESHEKRMRETGKDSYAWVYTAYKEAWEERQRLLEKYADRV